MNFKCLLDEQFLYCFVVNEYLALFHCPLIHFGLPSWRKHLSCSLKKAGFQDMLVLCILVKLSFLGPTILCFFSTCEKFKSGFCVLPLLFSFQSTAAAIGSSSVLWFQGSKVTECLVVPVLTCVSGELCSNQGFLYLGWWRLSLQGRVQCC